MKVLSYTRGRFTIADRAGLEAQSCECYRVVQDHLARIFPAANVQPSASGQT
jgi:hypothetical protein